MLRLYKNVKVHISKEIKTLIGIFFFFLSIFFKLQPTFFNVLGKSSSRKSNDYL